MSNSKIRSSSYFYSPLKVQSDQKEVIISHLKEQIYHLQKNQQQFYLLQEQYRNLDHKYRMLTQEKAIADVDFKERHELALRNIFELKNEIDALRAEIRERNLEINDLKTDENTLKNQIDQKLIEIERLKNDLASLLSDNDELLKEKLRLEEISQGVRKDNQSLLSNLKSTQIQNQSVKRRIDQMQKYMGQLKHEQAILKDRIINYENENNQLDADIDATIEDITVLDVGIAKAQEDICTLQRDIAEVTAFADKYKSESLHYQRATQNQIMKNNDTVKNISQAENVLRIRINSVQQGRKQAALLQGELQGLGKVNYQLEEDVQFCRRHLENLTLLNNQLVGNLQRFSEEDQIVRNLIDRRSRVLRAQARVEQVGNIKFLNTGGTMASFSSSYSPVRKSKIVY